MFCESLERRDLYISGGRAKTCSTFLVLMHTGRKNINDLTTKSLGSQNNAGPILWTSAGRKIGVLRCSPFVSSWPILCGKIHSIQCYLLNNIWYNLCYHCQKPMELSGPQRRSDLHCDAGSMPPNFFVRMPCKMDVRMHCINTTDKGNSAARCQKPCLINSQAF